MRLQFSSVFIMALFCTAFGRAGWADSNAAPMGAEAVLDQITQSISSNAAAPAENSGKVLREQLREEVDHFGARQAGLAPKAAAQEWMSLLDRLFALPPPNPSDAREMMAMSMPAMPGGISIQNLIEAMPGPAAWPEVATVLDARAPSNKDDALRVACLRVLSGFLDADYGKVQKDIDALSAQNRTDDEYNAERSKNALQALRMWAQNAGTNADNTVLQDFERLLQVLSKSKDQVGPVKVPDLVALASEKKAEELLGRVLTLPGVMVSVPCGRETRDLARRVATQRASELKSPPWELASSVDAVELFEALDRQFPQGSDEETPRGGGSFSAFWSGSHVNYVDPTIRQRAVAFYLLGLIALDHSDDAVKYLLKQDARVLGEGRLNKIWEDADESVPARRLFAFYETVLKEKPELPLWDDLVGLAPALGKTDAAVQMLNEAAARPGLGFEERVRIDEVRMRALLAADQPDAAMDVLRQIVSLSPTQETAKAQADFMNTQIELGQQMATLGRILERREWVDEGIAILEEAGKKGPGINEMSRWSSYSRDNTDLVGLLVELGRYGEAERVIMDRMTGKLKAASGAETECSPASYDVVRGDLEQLATVYSKAGRHEDVLCLLEKAPWWGTKDLAQYDEMGFSGCGVAGLPVQAAAALHAAGRDDEAVRVLKDHLVQFPADDRAYEILTAINGIDLIPWLDEVYARDRFEERPLIWKAVLLQKAGKIEDAEKTVRLALKVDPTDGETGPGDRVRGYAVLGDILDARGKKDDAKFFRNVVQSVRVAEAGDKLAEAGLIKRALAKYEEAQKSFADAYCVQWRLAEKLRALGDSQGADKHYKIAFERMPEQFGQVANFCFGCEGVFGTQHSRNAAESVLMRLATNETVRPQVFFLIGQLREAQQRYPEAYEAYRKAAALDPDYLDVWSKINSLADNVFLSRAERDTIVLRMLAMDPLQRHTCLQLAEVMDIKGLWGVLDAAQKYSIKTPESLFPLKASAAKIKETEAKTPYGMPYELMYNMYGAARKREVPKPGSVLVQHEVTAKLLELMPQGGGSTYFGPVF